MLSLFLRWALVMAGDWLKIRHNLDDDPHVLRLQAILQLADPDLLIAKLRNLWRHADQHTTDGLIRFADAAIVDRIARLDGLACALVEVGWLEITTEGAQVIRFDEHTGTTSKQRALTRARVQKHRSLQRYSNALQALPREEKRREDIGDESPMTPLAPSGWHGQPASEPEQAASESTATTGCLFEDQHDSGRAVVQDRGGSIAPPDQADAVLSFPVVGGKRRGGPAEWPLTASKLAEYAESFPGVDVLAECRKALQWCRDNPIKRKTFRGMAAFLSRWLAKVQDSGRNGKAIPRPGAGREPLADRFDRFFSEDGRKESE